MNKHVWPWGEINLSKSAHRTLRRRHKRHSKRHNSAQTGISPYNMGHLTGPSFAYIFYSQNVNANGICRENFPRNSTHSRSRTHSMNKQWIELMPSQQMECVETVAARRTLLQHNQIDSKRTTLAQDPGEIKSISVFFASPALPSWLCTRACFSFMNKLKFSCPVRKWIIYALEFTLWARSFMFAC